MAQCRKNNLFNYGTIWFGNSIENDSVWKPSGASLLCPGDDLSLCIGVCPGSSIRVYGACVQGCAIRCDNQAN